LFDLGETLISFDSVNSLSLLKRAARNSYDYLKSLGQPTGSFFCYFWRNFISFHIRCALVAITGRDFDSLALFKKVGTRRGISLNDSQWAQFAWLWYQPLRENARVEPDLAGTLARLKDAGLKLGLLSNTFVNGISLEKHLAQMGILQFLPVRLYSYDFPFRKPDPRIFQQAASRMGFVPANTLYVGDRINTDIKGALAAGMHAVLKNTTKNNNKPLPPGVFRIDAISALPEVIEKINISTGKITNSPGN